VSNERAARGNDPVSMEDEPPAAPELDTLGDLEDDEGSYDWQRVLVDVHLDPEESDFDLDVDDDDFMTED
jgi:hypothetical protein